MKLTGTPTLILALLASLAFAPAAYASEKLDAVIASYLEIQAQLAADSIEGVKARAAAIAKHAASMGAPAADIAAAAKALEQAKDLAAARDAFMPLSEAVITAARAEGWEGLDTVKLVYCPMVRGSWLQKDETIRNPYYGKGMLTCGEFKDKAGR